VSRRTPVRDLAIGVGAAGAVLTLFFAGTAGTVGAATLVATVVALIWFAQVDPARLVDDRGRPAPMLFLLGAVAVALMVTAALLLRTVTQYLAMFVALAAVITGVVRAIRFAMLPEDR